VRSVAHLLTALPITPPQVTEARRLMELCKWNTASVLLRSARENFLDADNSARLAVIEQYIHIVDAEIARASGLFRFDKGEMAKAIPAFQTAKRHFGKCQSEMRNLEVDYLLKTAQAAVQVSRRLPAPPANREPC
jgi:hypothetical protein